MSTTQHRDLEGLKALVTGATTGLGRAIAGQLAREGAEVVVHGRDPARGAQAVEAIRAEGGNARFVAADLSKPADLKRLAQEAGDVDILVNNAGDYTFGPTADFDLGTFDALFAANVRAPFALVAALAPGMAARGTGSIINISSMAGTIGMAGAAAYGATKAALDSMARSWAAEFSPRGVRVNTVAAGPVYTRPEERELYDTVGATTALKRAAQPEEIAEVVTFLASPRASYVTGATVAADGVRTAI
jgi:NAD(P)-dependent dehydrogenase (short-subunit alcohol dehydrogenase family)